LTATFINFYPTCPPFVQT